jgi:hypothetical protein
MTRLMDILAEFLSLEREREKERAREREIKRVYQP